jgi:hypothetical protein
LRAAVLLVLRFLLVPALSSMSSGSSSLHTTNEYCVNGKDILGKFVLVGARLIEENHEFCRMEGEYVLEEIEGESAESISVGNHNL